MHSRLPHRLATDAATSRYPDDVALLSVRRLQCVPERQSAAPAAAGPDAAAAIAVVAVAAWCAAAAAFAEAAAWFAGPAARAAEPAAVAVPAALCAGGHGGHMHEHAQDEQMRAQGIEGQVHQVKDLRQLQVDMWRHVRMMSARSLASLSHVLSAAHAPERGCRRPHPRWAGH